MTTKDPNADHTADNPTDPNLAQLEAMLADDQAATDAAIAAEDAGPGGYLPSLVERQRAAHQALLDVRPTDPTVIASWLRWCVDAGEVDEDFRPGLGHIAGMLEASWLLSPAAVGTIRAALVAAVEHHGGSVEAEHEPGLDVDTRAFEAQARTAITLLDAAPQLEERS